MTKFSSSSAMTNATASDLITTLTYTPLSVPYAGCPAGYVLTTGSGATSVCTKDIAGHAVDDVQAADFFTFGGVFTVGSPGYVEATSTSFVDIYAVDIIGVPSGTHYVNVTVDAQVNQGGTVSHCALQMILGSTKIGNDTDSQDLYHGHSMTAGHVSISPGNHTLHVQIETGSANYCRLFSGQLSVSGFVSPR
jgi:hypothetical protein